MSNDLSDNQKRAICRTLFLLLCALPTCVTIYFATHKRTPDQWAQLIQAELGVQTEISSVETLLPDELVFHELTLFDNDGKPIIESLGAKVFLGDVNQIVFPGQIEVTLSGLSDLMEELADRLVIPQHDAKQWKVNFEQVVVHGDRDGDFFAGPLTADCFNGRVSIECPLKQNSYEQSVRVEVARNDLGGFSVTLNSPEGFVPCWVARHWLPHLEGNLGADAEFAGIASIECYRSKTEFGLNGQFRRVRLPLSLAQTRDATTIYMNGVRVEGAEWTRGSVTVEKPGKSWRLDSSEYGRRSLIPQDDPFESVMRTAMHGDYETTSIY